MRTSSRTRSGFVLPDEREHLRPGLRLADDLEAAVGLERAPDPVEDEPVVVGDHDAHGNQCGTGLRRRLSLTRPRHREGPQPGEPVRPGHRSRPSSEGLLLPKSGDTLRRRHRPGPIALEARGGAHRVRIEFQEAKGENGDGEGGHSQAAGGRARRDDSAPGDCGGIRCRAGNRRIGHDIRPVRERRTAEHVDRLSRRTGSTGSSTRTTRTTRRTTSRRSA